MNIYCHSKPVLVTWFVPFECQDCCYDIQPNTNQIVGYICHHDINRLVINTESDHSGNYITFSMNSVASIVRVEQ
jgi:hypothetical protein